MGSEPSGWTWEQYEAYLVTEWRHILDRHQDNEADIHRFLELHPCMLPGGEGGQNSIGGHHGPFPGAVITKPRLPAVPNLIPDFLWPTKMSGVFSPVLLEIERPDKKWFGRSSQQSADLSQAISQVADWRTWFDSESHRLEFYKHFGISDWILDYHKVEPVYRLIYGRRAEFIDDSRLTLKRTSLRPDWLKWSTFDRLYPRAGARHWVTVKIESGKWKVQSVPPTFKITWDWRHALQGLDGLNEAIEKNELILDDRKEFLLAEVAGLDQKSSARPNIWENIVKLDKESLRS